MAKLLDLHLRFYQIFEQVMDYLSLQDIENLMESNEDFVFLRYEEIYLRKKLDRIVVQPRVLAMFMTYPALILRALMGNASAYLGYLGQ